MQSRKHIYYVNLVTGHNNLGFTTKCMNHNTENLFIFPVVGTKYSLCWSDLAVGTKYFGMLFWDYLFSLNIYKFTLV